MRRAALAIVLAACGRTSSPPEEPLVEHELTPQPPPSDFISIPAGPFYARPLRCAPGTLTKLAAPEDAVRGERLYGAAFHIDRHVASCVDYDACVDAGICVGKQFCRGDAALVSHEEAGAYCAWRGLKVQTAAEWQRAARGTDGRPWPSGFDEAPPICPHSELGCPAASESGFEYTYYSAAPEWARGFDCSEPMDGPPTSAPVAIYIGLDTLDGVVAAAFVDGTVRCVAESE